jgi:hypothetical protein
MRHILGRLPSGEQGSTPSWLPIHASLVPFVCGSLAGVTSWALIYPLDVCVSLLIIAFDFVLLTRLISKQRENKSSTESAGWRTLSWCV